MSSNLKIGFDWSSIIGSGEILAGKGIGDLSFCDMTVFEDDGEDDRAKGRVEVEAGVTVVVQGIVESERACHTRPGAYERDVASQRVSFQLQDFERGMELQRGDDRIGYSEIKGLIARL